MSALNSFVRYTLFFSFTLLMFNSSYAQDDWANLSKYKNENLLLKDELKSGSKVVFMGNSITEFWDAAGNTFFSDNHYINRGISGQTTPQMLIRFRQDVIDLQPAIVVILAGINDIAQNTGPATIPEIAGNIYSMAELAKANNITPIICSVLPADDFYWRPGLEPIEKIKELNRMLESYSLLYNIEFVDYYSAMVDNKGGLKKEFSEDGVHPNLNGYKVMEPLVKEAITRKLR